MRWISFAQSDALTRAVLHLLPTTRGGIAAQPVLCTLELFGDRNESAEVSIDGIRLNQPDGIRLDEAFPRLKEGGNSLIGLAVHLEPSQSKGDLRNSVCSVELLSRSGSVRYHMPLREEPIQNAASIPVLSDLNTQTSLIFANQGARFSEVQISAIAKSESGPALHPMNISLSPQSVSEYSLSSLSTQATPPFNCAWGEVSLHLARVASEIPAEVAAFVVYREAGSLKITSVVAL